jgi:hypothetical protein
VRFWIVGREIDDDTETPHVLGLLRPRRERLGSRRAAEKVNELTSPHFRTSGQRPALYPLKSGT